MGKVRKEGRLRLEGKRRGNGLYDRRRKGGKKKENHKMLFFPNKRVVLEKRKELVPRGGKRRKGAKEFLLDLKKGKRIYCDFQPHAIRKEAC